MVVRSIYLLSARSREQNGQIRSSSFFLVAHADCGSVISSRAARSLLSTSRRMA
uniref:Uncharacterized protein n=1 Tax=Triticum urartu TaxID=4572 RepID=A0A8R7Q761_TRIUA